MRFMRERTRNRRLDNYYYIGGGTPAAGMCIARRTRSERIRNRTTRFRFSPPHFCRCCRKTIIKKQRATTLLFFIACKRRSFFSLSPFADFRLAIFISLRDHRCRPGLGRPKNVMQLNRFPSILTGSCRSRVSAVRLGLSTFRIQR